MPSLNKFNSLASDLVQKVHDLNTDALMVMLTNNQPSASNMVLSDIIEIAAGNGYNAGGSVAVFISGNDVSGIYRLVLSPITWTATGGGIGPFQYAVLYNASVSGGRLIGWWDYGSPLSLINGDAFIAELDTTNGILTVQ